jgi:hypothetical protein
MPKIRGKTPSSMHWSYSRPLESHYLIVTLKVLCKFQGAICPFSSHRLTDSCRHLSGLFPVYSSRLQLGQYLSPGLHKGRLYLTEMAFAILFTRDPSYRDVLRAPRSLAHLCGHYHCLPLDLCFTAIESFPSSSSPRERWVGKSCSGEPVNHGPTR